MPAVSGKDNHAVQILNEREARAANDLLKRGFIDPTNPTDLRNGCRVGTILCFATDREAQNASTQISLRT